MKRFVCWFVVVGWFQCIILSASLYALTGCAAKAPVVTHKVVMYDTRYTDGVYDVLIACGVAVTSLTDDAQLVSALYQRCLINEGATL